MELQGLRGGDRGIERGTEKWPKREGGGVLDGGTDSRRTTRLRTAWEKNTFQDQDKVKKKRVSAQSAYRERAKMGGANRHWRPRLEPQSPEAKCFKRGFHPSVVGWARMKGLKGKG